MISESIDNTDVAEIMIKSQRIDKLKFGVTLDGPQLFVSNSITNWSMTLSCPSTTLWTSEKEVNFPLCVIFIARFVNILVAWTFYKCFICLFSSAKEYEQGKQNLQCISIQRKWQGYLCSLNKQQFFGIDRKRHYLLIFSKSLVLPRRV